MKCQVINNEKEEMITWPSIEGLYNVYHYMKKEGREQVVIYRPKVKLDGSNAGVQLLPSDYNGFSVIPQSRNRILDTENDNLGFAKWVLSNSKFFLDLRKNADIFGIKDHITIFGEWCGKGVQGRTAISKIESKIFAIFAIQIGKIDAKFETDPDRIRNILFGEMSDGKHQNVYILPWEGGSYEFDFTDPQKLESSTAIINQKVNDVEECDSWVKETFGIEGLGEGVVMYPIINNKTLIDKITYTDLVFKAKGEKHKVVKTKKPAQINPEQVTNIDSFIDLFVTENRLEQIAQNIDCFDMKNTGLFIKQFTMDVYKESVVELEASGMNWKQVIKEVSDRARKWWTTKCNNIM